MTTCPFCGIFISAFTKNNGEFLVSNIENQVCSYWFYKSIPKLELPSIIREKSQLYNFSFSLETAEKTDSVGDNSCSGVCKECAKELGKLGKLKEALEDIQKKVVSQVEILSTRRAGYQSEEKGPLEGTVRKKVALNGTVKDLNQICSTLNFLSEICQGIKESVGKRQESAVSVCSVVATQNAQPSIVLTNSLATAAMATNTGESSNSTEPEIQNQILLQPVNKFEGEAELITAEKIEPLSILPHDEELDSMEQDPLAAVPQATAPAPSNPNQYKNRKQCPDCGKWVYMSYIRIHRRTHTGEKPHLCLICGTRFTQKSSYNQHMKNHNDTGGYKCELCNREFNYRRNLVCHLKRVHKIQKIV